MTCSICKGKYTPHCHDQHPTCTWLRCVKCGTTIDLVGKQGFDKAGRRFKLVKPGP
jgi:hypothetical protein